MAYWLVKSEPSSFSWSQQEAVGVEPWTGVRNAAARQNLAAMRAGERALFYHSTEGRECVGIVEIAREAYPDPTDATGRWLAVDMRAVAPLPRPILRRHAPGPPVTPVGQPRLGHALAGYPRLGRVRALNHPD